MFERNRIDNADQSAVPVEITTDSGDVLTGRLILGTGRNIYEALNSQTSFFEFEPYGGDRTYFAKAALRHVKLIKTARAPDLAAKARDLDGFDPHAILGVAENASMDDVKAAWHKLAKTYHPDRYSTAELPNEVRDYLSAMARRINAAFGALDTAHRAKKHTAATRVVPIYTSNSRY